jgi:hypothetical protein
MSCLFSLEFIECASGLEVGLKLLREDLSFLLTCGGHRGALAAGSYGLLRVTDVPY